MSKNKLVPKSAKTNAILILVRLVAFGRKIITKTIPNLALSIVPTVFGETNLFCIRFCMTRPDTLTLAPAISRLIVLGSLEASKTRCCLLVQVLMSNGGTLTNPMKIDEIMSNKKKLINTSFFVIMLPFYSLSICF